MVTISISLEACDAVSATLPHGDVAQPPQIDERGGVWFLVDHKTLDRLTALRGPGESYSEVILRMAKVALMRGAAGPDSGVAISTVRCPIAHCGFCNPRREHCKFYNRPHGSSIAMVPSL